MSNCKICKHKTKSVISFGKMPVANAFIKKSSKKEFVFTLKLVFCPNCFMVQLDETVPPKKMFHSHYQFFSSTSKGMEDHFHMEAKHIQTLLKKKKDPFVVEIGSNDGIMLKHIASAGIRHLGVEPSSNVAKISHKSGVNVTTEFFSKNLAQKILKKYGSADVICGSNVICHIEDINSVFAGVSKLLAPDGVFFFEEPYMYDVVKNNSFDQIYDEHVYLYTGLSVRNLGRRHGLELVDMKHQDVHGGSMRYYLKKAPFAKVSNQVKKHLGKEKKLNLHSFKGYKDFKKNVDTVCQNLKSLLIKLKAKKLRVAGYAATSKSTTLLNYAEIGPDLIEYICDTTVTKIGLLTPGTGIPVKSHDYFKKDKPPYTILFAYNHKKEIINKEKDYQKKGGKFIIYFPKVVLA